MYYSNAPLLEVIAELRWSTSHTEAFDSAEPGAAIPLTPEIVSSTDRFYDRFALAVDDLGFKNSERLFPLGTPGFPGQAVVRHRRGAAQTPILQVGVGLFTANGVPPQYNGWSNFRVSLEHGVQALIEARPESEAERGFSVSLRYVDAFHGDFWSGANASDFITKVLGYGVHLPEGSAPYVDKSQPNSVSMQIQVPLHNSRRLQITVGEGTANDSPAVILDSVIQEEAVAPQLDAVLDSLDSMHEIQSSMFQTIASRLGELLIEEVTA